MQKEKFQEYLHHPESYKNADLSELEELTTEFPWFSSAAIILLHCSNIQSNTDFNLLLKKYSIHIPNRKVLHKLLNSGSYIPVTKSEPNEAKTITPDVSGIPGILDKPEIEVSLNLGHSEIHGISVLDDDSLLEFSYSPPKHEPGMLVRNEPDMGSTEENVIVNREEEPNSNPITEDKRNSFDHWISKMGTQKEEEEPLKKYEIIESFIHSDPGVIRADKETYLYGDVSKGSAEEHEGFITDTLAKIYVKQGLYNKAIYAYEKLCLKYPEKSIYFVTQIEEIKSLYIKK